ncbi:MAG: [protein-PII] uridylyltransferase [Pseudomonadota bacterium]
MEGSQEIVADFLESRESLIRGELKHSSGIRSTYRYANLMDRFVRSLFFSAGFRQNDSKADDEAMAVIALGGYGRRELCFCSDIDLMVIHRGRLSPQINEYISHAIYPLWDARLEVGHSILTYRECIRLAVTDFRVFTSLVDSRFLLGSRSFYELFQEAFWSRIYRERDSLLSKFLISREERAEKYGGEDHFVEPDLKEGLGGLRDLHLMDWMARTYFSCDGLNQIRRFAVFSHFELDKLAVSKSFLLKVRNHLHFLAGRKEDRLLLGYQDKVSRDLGYGGGPNISGPEKLMRDLYLHLNRIRYRHEEFEAKALDMLDPSPADPTPGQLPPEFQVIKGNIVLKEGSLLEKDTLIILRALKEANQRGLFLGSGFIWEAKEIIAKKGKELLDASEGRELFLEIILKSKDPKIIRLALEIGLITLFIPQFKRIRNLPQFGFYHVMTVDLHSLRALEVVNEISRGVYDERWPLLKKVFDVVRDPDWLFLAAFLHDIGKGYGKDHAEKGGKLIIRILKRLGINGKALQIIPFLVKHHLLLVNISQRRDLSYEKTSVQVAQTIQDKEVLKLLFLLTVADSFATGPMARSDWKIMLLTELFMKVRRILERGLLASPDATTTIEARKRSVLKALASDFPERQVLELIDQVSSRYFLSATPEDMVHHFRMALTLGKETHAWVLQRLTDAPVTRVIQCTYDKPGLFSKMVGVFTLHNMEILSANIFTVKNGLAFDIYEVTNPLDRYREAERWDKALKDVRSALKDRLPLDDLIREKGQAVYPEEYRTPITKRVRIDNETSDFFTVIEVSSGMKMGLAYRLAKQIFSLGLNIRFAKVNSDEEKIMGVFYVCGSGGQKIFEQDRIVRIREEMMAVGEG